MGLHSGPLGLCLVPLVCGLALAREVGVLDVFESVCRPLRPSMPRCSLFRRGSSPCNRLFWLAAARVLKVEDGIGGS